MSLSLLLASAVAFVVLLAHVFSGGRECVDAMYASSFDSYPRETVYACWHIVSLHLALGVIVLLLAGLLPSSAAAWTLARAVGVLYVLYALVFLQVARSSGLPGGLRALPQWAVLLPLGLYVCWATL